MDDRQGNRRRIASALVAIVAAGATIATSQSLIESRLEGSDLATVRLDDGAPRAVGRFVLTLSSAALPVGTTAGPAPTGTVTFGIDRAGGTGAGPSGPVAVTAEAIGISHAAKVELGVSSWPIEQLCRVGEPCRREFAVSAEWLEPQDGGSISVAVRASVLVRFGGWEVLPAGATATWEDEAFTPLAPAPAVSADADLGRVTVGRDSPVVARRVLLRGSAALLADPASVDVSAFVRAVAPAGLMTDVDVTLVRDGGTFQEAVGPGTFIQPFTGCPRAAECVRGFTIVARWKAGPPDGTVDLDWSFDARARFDGKATAPVGATLTAEVVDRLDLGLASARLQATATGSFVLPSGTKTSRVRLVVTAPALGDAYFGAPPPAVAIVRLHATLKDPSASAKLRVFVSNPDNYGLGSLPLAVDGTELQRAAIALGRCERGVACTGYIELTVDGTDIPETTISWDVAVELPVPRPQLAVGDLRVEVASAR